MGFAGGDLDRSALIPKPCAS